MYVYIKSEPGLWTAGFYSPDGKWISESDHNSTDAAAARVNYLNGGRLEEEDNMGEWEPPDPETKVFNAMEGGREF